MNMSFALDGICGEGMFFAYNPVTGIAALITLVIMALAIPKQKKITTKIATLITGIMAAGVFGALDLFTNYICFEVAGFASLFLLYDNAKEVRVRDRNSSIEKEITHDEDGEELLKPEHEIKYIELSSNVMIGSMGDSESIIATKSDASKDYLGWVLISGMVMTLGMFFISHFAGIMEFSELNGNLFQGSWVYVVAFCYYVGFGVRGCQMPFHSWLGQFCAQMEGFQALAASVMLLPGGLYSIDVLFPKMFPDSVHWEGFFLLMGVLTMIAGVAKFFNSVTGKCRTASIYIFIMGISQVLFYLSSRYEIVVIAMVLMIVTYAVYGRRVQDQGYPEPLFDIRWCSLENLVYRPVFKAGLPLFFGIIFRAIDYFPDSIVALLRGTVYQDSKQKVWDKVGTPGTYILGKILDDLMHGLNRTILRRHPYEKSFVNGLAVAKKEAEDTTGIFMKSVSFGLMMFAIGMIATLIYMAF